MGATLITTRQTRFSSPGALVLLFFGSHIAFALNPSVAVSQYSHKAWRVQDGAFEGTPAGITQTTDGYLWLSTSSGLFRFDGVRFVRVTMEGIPENAPRGVLAILGARDGSLWVGGYNVLLQWKDGDWKQSFAMAGRVNDIEEAPDGVIWAAQSRTSDKAGGFCSVLKSELRCYGKEFGVSTAGGVFPRPDGSMWISAPGGVLEWKDGRGTILKPKGIETFAGLHSISVILPEEDGSSLVAMTTIGPGLGLQHLSKEGLWSPYMASGFDGSTVSVFSLRKDREGNLWVATQGDGLYRIHSGSVSHYGRAEGLSSNGVFDFFEDREGNMWVCTAMGIDRFRNLPVVTYSDSEGLSSPAVSAILAARDGIVWISNGTGLNFIRDGRIQVLSRSAGLRGDRITSLLQDFRGRLWIGVDNKLAILEAGHIRFINRPDGSAIGAVQMITEDTNHDIWVRVAGSNITSLVRVDVSMAVSEVDIPQLSKVVSLLADPRGGLWIASGSSGLWHYEMGQAVPLRSARGNGKIDAGELLVETDGALIATTPTGFFRWQNGMLRAFGTANGLPCTNIFSLVMSRRGSLWLYSECGVIEINRQQLERWWNNPGVRLDLKWLTAQDGALPARPSFVPAASESPDGRLWFATTHIVQMVDPGNLQMNVLPPPVHIEQVVADRKPYPPNHALPLPTLTGDLEFDYTAVSLVSPEKVRFRYKLDGYDSSWRDAGTRRQAFYTNLTPRQYVFHVIACNNDGVWNNVGATLQLSIAPAYYQTSWFMFACALSALLAAWTIFRLRLHQATETVRERLSGQVAERERIARELHDTFLQGLYAVVLRFQTIADTVSKDMPARHMMEDALTRADLVLAQGRDSLRGLRGELSLLMSVAEELEQLAQECRLDCETTFILSVTGQDRALHPVIRDEIVQIGKEAILNSFRHSGAALIDVKLCFDSAFFSLSVVDDGRGIDPLVLAAGGKQGHWGMLGMRERSRKIGAQFTISSPPQGRTEVKLRIPANLAYTTRSGLSWWSKLFGLPSSQKSDQPVESEKFR
jgi:signal transduction histidine kinase/ligand-binding sensor domain-containing protein